MATPGQFCLTTQIPGPKGDTGAAGTNGTNGVSAFTTTTAAFVMPAEGADVTASVGDSTWMTATQIVYVGTAGYMQVQSKPTTTSVSLRNLENTASSLYTSNAAPATNIPLGSQVSPAGLIGPTGSAAASPAPPDATYITQTPNGTLTNEQALSALATGYVKNTTGTGVLTVQAVPIPIADGGTNGITAVAAFNNLSPVTTRGDLITRDATNNVRLAIGAANTVLRTAGTDPAWGKVDLTTDVTGVLPAANGGGGPAKFLAEYQLAAATLSGAFTSGAQRVVPLNTEVYDTATIGGVGGNQITGLVAATYRFSAWMIGYNVDDFQCLLWNATNATVIAYGSTGYSAAVGGRAAYSFVAGRVTLGAVTAIELRAQCTTTNGTTGFGPNLVFGTYDVKASVTIEKEA